MYHLKRAAVVVGAIFAGVNLANYFVLERATSIKAALMQDGRGRSIKADFGGTTPEAMKSMLSQYNGTADNCPRA